MVKILFCYKFLCGCYLCEEFYFEERKIFCFDIFWCYVYFVFNLEYYGFFFWWFIDGFEVILYIENVICKIGYVWCIGRGVEFLIVEFGFSI